MLSRQFFLVAIAGAFACTACGKDAPPEPQLQRYNIVVRFFGDPVSPANQAMFQNAATRLERVITGEIADATANVDLSGPDGCEEPGMPVVNETVDDIIIYAAITAIDGVGSTLGAATPCVGRPTPEGTMVAIGFMKFDIADFPNFSNPQEVVIHEMLHVLGSGTLWGAAPTGRNLISGEGSSDPRYTGTKARLACVALGATNTCATSIPLENQGGTGTRDFHWRESLFQNELMTGFYNAGANPLSKMTIASMADLGFVVDTTQADAYTFSGTTQMSGLPSFAPGWERVGQLRGMLKPNGRVERIR